MKRLVQAHLPKSFGRMPLLNELPRGCRLYIEERWKHTPPVTLVLVRYAGGHTMYVATTEGRAWFIREVWRHHPTTKEAIV